jgi:hypothetical protein
MENLQDRHNIQTREMLRNKVENMMKTDGNHSRRKLEDGTVVKVPKVEEFIEVMRRNLI